MRYSDSGSIGFSEIEKNAYRLALTLEITHIAAPQYTNVKTLPPNTHFGYATLFRGSTVTDSISIKYPKFRVFDIINSGIWAYHELTESKQLQSSEVAESVAYGTDVVGLVFDWVLDSVSNAWEFVFGENEGGSGQSYRAYPVASPFPDVAKFKADIPCSFLWRLEAWYLVNPAVYIADNPSDTGDETEGEDEYPEPIRDEPFPESSPAGEGRDPRDYSGGNPSEIPFEGGQCPGVLYRVNIERDFAIAPPYAVVPYDVIGPIRGIRSELELISEDVTVRKFYLRHGEPEIEVQLGAAFLVICQGSPVVCEPNPGQFAILNVARLDGEPDACGNPLPVET